MCGIFLIQFSFLGLARLGMARWGVAGCGTVRIGAAWLFERDKIESFSIL